MAQTASDIFEQMRKEFSHLISSNGKSLDLRTRTELAQIISLDAHRLLKLPSTKPWRNVIKTAIHDNYENIVDILNCSFSSLKESFDNKTTDLATRNNHLRSFYSTYYNTVIASLEAEEDNVLKCTTILDCNLPNETLHHQPLPTIFNDSSLYENGSIRRESSSTERRQEITTTFQHSPDRISEIPSSSSETFDELHSEGNQKEIVVTSSLGRLTPDTPKNDSTPKRPRLMSEKVGERAEQPEPIIEIGEEQPSLEPQRHHELNLKLSGTVVAQSSKQTVQETTSPERSIKETTETEPSTQCAGMQHSGPNDDIILAVAGTSNDTEPNTPTSEHAGTTKGETPPNPSETLVQQSAENLEKDGSVVKEVGIEAAEIVEETGVVEDEAAPKSIPMKTSDTIIDSRDTSIPIPDGKNSKNTDALLEPVEHSKNDLDGGEDDPNIDAVPENSSVDNPPPEQPLVPQQPPNKTETLRRSARDRAKVARNGTVEYDPDNFMKSPLKSAGTKPKGSRTNKRTSNRTTRIVDTTPESSVTPSEGVDLRNDSNGIDADMPFISNPDLYKTVRGTEEASKTTTPKKPQRKRRRRSANQGQASESTSEGPDPKINESSKQLTSQPSSSAESSTVHSSWNVPPLDYSGNPAIDYPTNYNWPYSNYYYGQNTTHGSFQTAQNTTEPPTGCDFGFQPNVGFNASLDSYPGVSLNYPQYLHGFNSNPES